LDPPSPIKKLFPNSTGSRVVVVDIANRSFLFNPVTGGGLNQSITQFDSSPQNIVNIIWDLAEKNVIIFFDGKFIHSYVYANTSIKGPLLIKLGPITVSSEGEVALSADKTELVPGNFPLLSIGGSMTCQTVAGILTTIAHPYFDKLVPAGTKHFWNQHF
jgi:WD repeat-containing protein 19